MGGRERAKIEIEKAELGASERASVYVSAKHSKKEEQFQARLQN